MGSKVWKATNLFLVMNLFCYTVTVMGCATCGAPYFPFPTPPTGGGGPGFPFPTPPTGGGGPGFPFPTPPTGGGVPGIPGGGVATCPRDALKLGVCANLLGGLVGVVIGSPPTLPCCSLLAGLVDLEAAVCLCTAIRANVLGINLNIPVSLSLLLNVCGRTIPTGFICA